LLGRELFRTPSYSSPNVIRVIKIKKNMDRTFGTRGRDASRDFVGVTWGKKTSWIT